MLPTLAFVILSVASLSGCASRSEQNKKIEFEDVIGQVAFSPDGQTLAVADSSVIVLLDPTSLKTRASLKGHTNEINALAFSPIGKMLASAGFDGDIRIWDIEAHKELALLRGSRSWIAALAFSADGKILAAAGGGPEARNGELWFWDVNTKKLSGSVRDLKSWGTAVHFVPNREQVVVSCSGDEPELRALPSGKLINTFDVAHFGSHFSALSPDGQILVTSYESSVVALDLASGKKRRSFFDGDGSFGPISVGFSPDGKLLAVALGRSDKELSNLFRNLGEIRLFDVSTGQQIASRQRGKRVNCVAFSPDSQLLAIGGGLGAKGEVEVLKIKDLLPPGK